MRERAFTAALRDFVAGERGDAVDLLAAYGVDRVRTMVEQLTPTRIDQRTIELAAPADQAGAQFFVWAPFQLLGSSGE